jgi:hypothetical protein
MPTFSAKTNAERRPASADFLRSAGGVLPSEAVNQLARNPKIVIPA